MFSKFELSPFFNKWIDGPEGVFIRGGLVLIAIGTTGYLINKVFNNTSTVNSSEENFATELRQANRAYSTTVKEHLHATYAHFAGGLLITGSSAYIFYRTGWSEQVMTKNKWISVGGALLLTAGSCFATKIIDQHQRPVLKYTAWTLFNSSFGLTLSPLCCLDSSLLAHAALLTTGVVASISVVGMSVRRERYLWLGAPLMAGVCVVCLTSVSSMILSATAVRALSVSDWFSLYGGLVIFSGVLLFDTYNIINKAENAQDPRRLSSIDESLDIYVDTINIFIRILTLLSKNNERQRKRPTSTGERK